MANSGNVLIVDDSSDSRALLSKHLGSIGLELTESNSGDATLGLADDHLAQFGTIVLDIEMPGKNGWQTATELRERGYQGTLIACSSFGYTGNNFDFTNRSFNQILRKPFSKSQLLSCFSQSAE